MQSLKLDKQEPRLSMYTAQKNASFHRFCDEIKNGSFRKILFNTYVNFELVEEIPYEAPTAPY